MRAMNGRLRTRRIVFIEKFYQPFQNYVNFLPGETKWYGFFADEDKENPEAQGLLAQLYLQFLLLQPVSLARYSLYPVSVDSSFKIFCAYSETRLQPFY